MRLARLRPLLLLAAAVVGVIVVAGRPNQRRGRPGKARPGLSQDCFGMRAPIPRPHQPDAWTRRWSMSLVERAASKRPGSRRTSRGLRPRPFNIGGRITALAWSPAEPRSTSEAANGGVFSRPTWHQLVAHLRPDRRVYSIGRSHSIRELDTLYCGTGEPTPPSTHTDGAASTCRPTRARAGRRGPRRDGAHRRLSRSIPQLDPHPRRGDGPQFSTTPNRGLYRHRRRADLDQDAVRQRRTGACDVVLTPINPDTVYAATWERVRHPTYRRPSPGCGIWRSPTAATP